MKEISLKIQGMSCGHCTQFIENTLTALPGIEEVAVTLKDGTAYAKYDQKKVNAKEIAQAIEETHFILLSSVEL